MPLSELDKVLFGETEPELSELDKVLFAEPESSELDKALLGETPAEPKEEPTWWGEAWGGLKDFGEWLYPEGWESVVDIPKQYGAALQKGGMAAGEAMTWLTRLLPGNEDRKPYAEQTTAEQAWTVAQAGATFAVTQELIRAGIASVGDLKLNIKTLFAKEQSKPISQAINEIYKSVAGRPLSDSPEAIARYRAILAYKKDLPSAEVTRLTSFINKTTIPVLPSPSLVTPPPTQVVAPAITKLPIVTPTGQALAIKTNDIITDGLISGRVIGEVVLGKNIPAFKVEILSGREKGQISAIIKNQAQLEKPKMEITPKPEIPIVPEKEFVAPTPEVKPTVTPEIAPKGRISEELKPLADEVRKYKSAEEFEAKVDTELLDKIAFGFKSGDVIILDPKQLDIKYKSDFENAKILEGNITEMPPIDVSLSGGKFYIEDGYNRYKTALAQKKNIKAKIDIKDNPIVALEKRGIDLESFYAKPTELPEIAPKAKEPWEMSREELEADPRFVIKTNISRTTIINKEKVGLPPTFFDRPKVEQEHIIKHELAHLRVHKLVNSEELWKIIDSHLFGKYDKELKEFIPKEGFYQTEVREILAESIVNYEDNPIKYTELHPQQAPLIKSLIEGTFTGKPEIAPKAEIERVAPISEKPIELATPKQIKQAHVIARDKAMISEKGKMKPQYRSLAKMMIGKKSISEMTKDEATIFIEALNKLPEPTKNAMGELVPPSITKIRALVPKEFFERKFKEPTIAKYLTSQTYYAEKLGIKSLVEPSEIGKQEFDLEFRNVNKTVDQAIKKIDVIGKTTVGEKVTAKVKNIPTKAVVNMAELLNKYEEPPETLPQEQKDIFNWFRSLNREILKRENEVRKSLDFKPIEYKEAYLRHTADTMAKEMLRGEYPFPQGLKYWSEKIIGKKIFNPMEFQRKLSDDLIDLWTKDLAQATKSMLWSGLKEIHLGQPVKILSKYLNALSKDTKIYKDLTPEEKLAYQKSVIPASTKKWLINYENQVIKGQSSELDANVNRIITESGLKGLFNKVLSPFGRTVGEKPITDMFQFAGRLTISGVMGWIPRQIIRNSFQSVQNLALYGVKATTKAFLPVSATNDKNLKELLTDSLFLKSYTAYEELPVNIMGKLERLWLAPYGVVATFNAKTAMKAAYWDTLDLIKNAKYKDFGWADPQRTKDTPKDYLYPSEKEKLLKEMEFGSGATQYQYIPMGMPELFRHKAFIPLTRLQSWWMNYFAKFTREALHRAFKGETSYGAKLPWSRRVNYLKYLLIGGAVLTGMGYKRSFLIGVLPTYLSPAGQVALGLYSYATAKSDWQRQQALKKIQFSWTAFIPGSLAWKDFIKVWKGEKELKELFFYKQPEKKKKKRYIRPY